MKYLVLISLILANISAKNINYAKNELHTLTPKKGTLEFELNLLMMNDTIDLLKLKEKEFGNSSKFDSIGDLEGYDIAFKYAILDDFMISARYSIEEIEYSSSSLSNTKLDIYARYNLFDNKMATLNSGISIDFGYVTNKLKDFYIRDLDTIQQTIKTMFANLGGTISKINATTLMYADNNLPPTTTFITNPYIVLKDTEDKSYYLRLLTGFYSKNSYTNFYTGIKTTSIKNTISTTQQVINLAATENITLPLILDRKEKTIFAGFNYTLDTNTFIYEFNYEYAYFIRDKGLDYMKDNHIINISVAYPIAKKLLLTTGAKIMYRQLNGQIPYLYNEYTQTSYDHKYGYASFGIIYNFN